jgi:hypothetical protein
VGFVSLSLPQGADHSELILTQLSAGDPVETFEGASVIVNTCGFIDDAVGGRIWTGGGRFALLSKVVVWDVWKPYQCFGLWVARTWFANCIQRARGHRPHAAQRSRMLFT